MNVSLTPQGEAAPRDVRATTTRVFAALGRTTTPAKSGVPADWAAEPDTRTARTSSRAR